MHKSAFLLEGLTLENIKKAKELNLDSIVVNSELIAAQNIETTKKEIPSIKVYAEVRCFTGKELLEKYPDAKPVEAQERETSIADFVALCPTHPKVRKAILEKIKNVIALDVDGIWLDYLHYPTKFDLADPVILDACYCNRCLKMFEEAIGEPIEGVGGEGTDLENTALYIDGSYYHEWLEFKAEQIVSILREARTMINDSGKDIKLGALVIPWEDKEHGAAIKRLLAQDFGKFTQYVDELIPMLPHKSCGKPVEWIKEKVEYFWNVGVSFLPLIQTKANGISVDNDEFKLAVKYASTKPSSGFCVSCLEDLVDQKKLIVNAAVIIR